MIVKTKFGKVNISGYAKEELYIFTDISCDKKLYLTINKNKYCIGFFFIRKNKKWKLDYKFDNSLSFYNSSRYLSQNDQKNKKLFDLIERELIDVINNIPDEIINKMLLKEEIIQIKSIIDDNKGKFKYLTRSISSLKKENVKLNKKLLELNSKL